MAKKLYEEAEIADIAVAIREKGGTGKYKTEQMGDAVRAISGAEPLAEYEQQNPLVGQYLEESQFFSPDDYTVTVPDFLSKFVYAEPGYVRSHPFGYNITAKQAGDLHLTDGGGVLVQSAAAGDHELVNSTPGKVACWWLTEDASIKQSGTIKPTGQVRMIKTTAANVRDIGGWACDGGTVKYGKLFRGGELSTSDRWVLFYQLGIRHDIDLRNATERGGITESPLGADIHYTTVDSAPMYTLTPVADWRTILRTIFDAARYNEPVYLHCKMGADRTGTVACIVAALLGVSQTDCDRDFELTSLATKPDARRRTDANWISFMGLINALPGDTFRDKAVNWCGNTLGFTAEELNAFRHAMIDGNPADVVIEGAEESEYQRVEWVRIVDGEALNTNSHVLTKLAWADVNKIVCKFSCAHTATTKDMLFATYDGATVGSAPFAATQSGYILTNNSGLNNYAVSPNNIPTTDQDPHEYTLTFSCANADPIKFGGWGDDNYSHPHNWYFVQLYKDDTLLAEFLPHYRKDDPTAGGFLETVSGEFYLDAGRGNVGFAIMGDPI